MIRLEQVEQCSRASAPITGFIFRDGGRASGGAHDGADDAFKHKYHEDVDDYDRHERESLVLLRLLLFSFFVLLRLDLLLILIHFINNTRHLNFV